MLRSLLCTLLLTAIASPALAADYRGMPAGWPGTAPGYAPAAYSAGYAPANPAGYQLYTAARPSYAPPLAYYAARPNYPTSSAYYAPTTAYYAPQGAYAAPGYAQPGVTAYSPIAAPAMQPAYGLAAPAGSLPVTRAYYGQAGALNIAQPPAYAYRTYYAPVPVTYYRPVTTYQPVTGQPITCLQPAQSTCCEPRRCGLFDWLFRGSSCGTQSCGYAPQQCTTNYCGSSCAPQPQACGGAAPYYPVVPVNPIPTQPYIIQPGSSIPVVPAPTGNPPLIGTPRVPPPPTRIPSGIPADNQPSLAPGGLAPGSTFIPGTAAPGSTIPGTTLPPSSVPFNPGSTVPRTEYYPPTTDSGSRFETNRFGDSAETSPSTLRFSPPANVTPNGVRVVPDPDVQIHKPVNRAPQLINPADRSAALGNQRWAVVPAVWPTKTGGQTHASGYADSSANNSKVGGRVVHVTHRNDSRQLDQRSDFAPTSSFVPQTEAALDDSGWTSGR